MLTRMPWVVALLALDLWSKSAVFAYIDAHPEALTFDPHFHRRWEIISPWFSFMQSWNPGMAWGMEFLPTWLLVGGRIVASVFLLWLVAKTPRTKPWLSASFVLIAAGAMGNLYDNLFMPRVDGRPFGMVRDFIDVYFTGFDWHFHTFNVADSCISVGAVILFATGLFGKDDKPENPPAGA
ncbi:MAG: signal peptidase II [Planctomycetes bacterium]|nr:signal peptidase II [Planctomycetota bacterium]